MVTTCLVISKSSSPFNNLSMTVSRAPIATGINVTFKFRSFFISLGRSRYLSFFSLSYNYTLWSAGTAKSTILLVLFFLLIILRSVRLDEIWWSVCISKSLRRLCVSFSRMDSWLCIYNLFMFIIIIHVSFPPQRSARGLSLVSELQSPVVFH